MGFPLDDQSGRQIGFHPHGFRARSKNPGGGRVMGESTVRGGGPGCVFPDAGALQATGPVLITRDMGDDSKAKSGGGCLAKLVLLFLLVAALGLGTAVFFIVRPQDLSDIGGYGPPARNGGVRDLKVVLQNSVNRGYAVTLTEAEINQWLAGLLSMKQGGVLGGQVSLDRVWVRLLDGHAEVIMERSVMGRPFTVSMFLRPEQLQGLKGIENNVHLDGGPYHPDVPYPPRGGRFGSLVVPQGFLILVKPAYEKLAALFQDEINLAFERMARVKIEKNGLVLDPRDPQDEVMKLPMTF
jgi:hypothetical protein